MTQKNPDRLIVATFFSTIVITCQILAIFETATPLKQGLGIAFLICWSVFVFLRFVR